MSPFVERWRIRSVTWVELRLLAEVSYAEIVEGRLRAPSGRRLIQVRRATQPLAPRPRSRSPSTMGVSRWRIEPVLFEYRRRRCGTTGHRAPARGGLRTPAWRAVCDPDPLQTPLTRPVRPFPRRAPRPLHAEKFRPPEETAMPCAATEQEHGSFREQGGSHSVGSCSRALPRQRPRRVPDVIRRTPNVDSVAVERLMQGSRDHCSCG
jgi:hypothetical protein